MKNSKTIKIKLTELVLSKLNYIPNQLTNCDSFKMINVTYDNLSLTFQTPKMILKEIIKTNNKEYMSLEFTPNNGSKMFIEKLLSFEENHDKYLSESGHLTKIKSLYNHDKKTLLVKIPIKYSKPLTKVIKDSQLFNYYHLTPGTQLICLLSSNSIWINDQNPSYNLTVNEILIT